MKGKEEFFEFEKYFDFLKMDKKNVKNGKAKILLTDEKFCLDTKNLWCQFKRKKYFFLMIKIL